MRKNKQSSRPSNVGFKNLKMDIQALFIGKTIVEIEIEIDGTNIKTGVADLNGMVNINLIEQLQEVVDELTEHNERIANETEVVDAETIKS